MFSVAAHLGLLIGDAVDSETALHVIDQTEILTSLLNADHICNRTPQHCPSTTQTLILATQQA